MPREQFASGTSRVAAANTSESDLSNSDVEDLEYSHATRNVADPSSAVAVAEVSTSCSTGFTSAKGPPLYCNRRVSFDSIKATVGGDQTVESENVGDESLSNTNDNGETLSTKSEVPSGDGIDF